MTTHQLTDVELKVALVGIDLARDMLADTIRDTKPSHKLSADTIRLKTMMDDFMSKFESLVNIDTEVGT